MIIAYFSATGNSKYVATRIVKDGDELLSIPDLIGEGRFELEDDVIGIVAPTYSWGLPSIVVDFLSRSKIEADYVFYISTYGTTPGSSMAMAKKLQPCIEAFYSVRMVDAWTVMFDLSKKEKVDRWTKDTERQIDDIVRMIDERKVGGFMQRGMPAPIGRFVYANYEKMRRTSHLHVEDTCIGCGLCVKRCPVGAIEMKDKRPVWTTDKCVMCLGCLHRCPRFAIQYDDRTKGHGQYRNPNVEV